MSYLVGKRIEISPHFDAWMQGDRFGEITKVTSKYITVKMDRSQRVLRLPNKETSYTLV